MPDLPPVPSRHIRGTTLGPIPPLLPVKQQHQQQAPPVSPLELRDFKFPMMSKRDTSNGRLKQTSLNGQVLAAFHIGGEHRICLKQVVHQIPNKFADTLINKGRKTLISSYLNSFLHLQTHSCVSVCFLKIGKEKKGLEIFEKMSLPYQNQWEATKLFQ